MSPRQSQITSFGKMWLGITTSSTIRIGTARNAPTGPHSQVQNTNDKNTVGGLRIRPASHDGRRDKMTFQRGEAEIKQRREQRVA